MLQRLRYGLSNDHALQFDCNGTIVTNKGWMSKYVSGPVTYIDDPLETCMSISRSGLLVDDHDEYDMRIIAREAGYSVNITDRMITFEII